MPSPNAEWFDQITAENVTLNVRLQSTFAEFNRLQEQAKLVQSLLFEERQHFLKDYTKKLKPKPKNGREHSPQALLLPEIKKLFDEHAAFIKTESKFRRRCLEQQKNDLKGQLEMLNEQISHCTEAIKKIRDKSCRHKQSEISGPEKLLKLGETVKEKIKRKSSETQTQLNKSKKIVQLLQGQRAEIERRRQFYEELDKREEEDHAAKTVSLKKAIEVNRLKMKEIGKRQLLDAEGFLSDLKILNEKLLKIERQARDLASKNRIRVNAEKVRDLIGAAEKKIITAYSLQPS